MLDLTHTPDARQVFSYSVRTILFQFSLIGKKIQVRSLKKEAYAQTKSFQMINCYNYVVV